MEEIQRMQDNLLLIRRTVGWTAEKFGDQIGVTRQTINNIESGRNKLTKTQYIAMRSVIEAEMVKHPDETEMLRSLLDMLVDHPEKYTEDEYSSLLEKANMMAPSILTGTASRATVSKEWMKSADAIGALLVGVAVTPIVGAPAVTGVAIGGWLAKAIKSSSKKGSGKKMSNSKDGYVTKKKNMNFQSVEALQSVMNVVNEAAAALNDKERTIGESAIPEVLAGVLGAGIGGVGSFAALYGLGSVGLSAAGITSGLAEAGRIVGGGMVAGVFVLAAPVAVLGGVGVCVASHLKHKQLRQEKERLYREALSKHDAIIKALKEEADAARERLDYLQSLNILLQRAIKDLQKDLGVA